MANLFSTDSKPLIRNGEYYLLTVYKCQLFKFKVRLQDLLLDGNGRISEKHKQELLNAFYNIIWLASNLLQGLPNPFAIITDQLHVEIRIQPWKTSKNVEIYFKHKQLQLSNYQFNLTTSLVSSQEITEEQAHCSKRKALFQDDSSRSKRPNLSFTRDVIDNAIPLNGMGLDANEKSKDDYVRDWVSKNECLPSERSRELQDQHLENSPEAEYTFSNNKRLSDLKNQPLLPKERKDLEDIYASRQQITEINPDTNSFLDRLFEPNSLFCNENLRRGGVPFHRGDGFPNCVDGASQLECPRCGRCCDSQSTCHANVQCNSSKTNTDQTGRREMGTQIQGQRQFDDAHKLRISNTLPSEWDSESSSSSSNEYSSEEYVDVECEPNTCTAEICLKNQQSEMKKLSSKDETLGKNLCSPKAPADGANVFKSLFKVLMTPMKIFKKKQ